MLITPWMNSCAPQISTYIAPTCNIITITKEEKQCLTPGTKRQLLEHNKNVQTDRK